MTTLSFALAVIAVPCSILAAGSIAAGDFTQTPGDSSKNEVLIGIYEGRTPCAPTLVEFAGYGGGGCEKMKWHVELYQDRNTGAPTRYVFDGTRVQRQGRWTKASIATSPGGMAYRLDTNLVPGGVRLLRVSDGVLVFLDARMRPMVGDASWSYVLNRTGPKAVIGR